MKKAITLTVNGDIHELYVETHHSLLDVIRNELGLVGTHRGCDTGNCGACTLHLDGLAMNACLLLAVDYDGSEILTIEGITQNGALHPLQQALVEKGGIQCGFCTPGVVMNTLALLADNPHPSKTEIRARLSGNLCRCTGYVKIVEAIMSVSH
ncbi:MAG TPA: (2Fe-2S)-binding protein [Anaerolineales bacterium]|nr:(2Fe-2S)-binding protein [Anaerolineales bacterium]